MLGLGDSAVGDDDSVGADPNPGNAADSVVYNEGGDACNHHANDVDLRDVRNTEWSRPVPVHHVKQRVQ